MTEQTARYSGTLAVIGGGYAGMAAAVTLAAQNIAVTVFEAGKQLGGRAPERAGVLGDDRRRA